MKRTVKLTESDLARIVRRVIKEQDTTYRESMDVYKFVTNNKGATGSFKVLEDGIEFKLGSGEGSPLFLTDPRLGEGPKG